MKIRFFLKKANFLVRVLDKLTTFCLFYVKYFIIVARSCFSHASMPDVILNIYLYVSIIYVKSSLLFHTCLHSHFSSFSLSCFFFFLSHTSPVTLWIRCGLTCWVTRTFFDAKGPDWTSLFASGRGPPTALPYGQGEEKKGDVMIVKDC